ncbi:MAG: carbohydrate kinase [Gammaproteobacteria bacterium]|nr:carbohydrate kinase [Gammaproteobacteria bacterium]
MEQGTNSPRVGRPLIYGEVLFDCFPGGQEVMGGAPFNVAWHLAGLGAMPLLVSRIGQDPRGEAVLAGMRDWGMDVSGIQIDAQAPTGQVQIALTGTDHSFNILPDQAYDRIATESALAAVADSTPALLYCGSLITRNPIAHETLIALQRATAAPTFVDINLRAPWWELARVETLMRSATWLKINDDELHILRGPASSVAETEALAAQLRAQFDIAWVILTRGADGAIYIGEETHRGKPPAVTELIDTIGAGDAFSAVTILGLLQGWPKSLTLTRALAFAARICAQRGATESNHALYTELREAWGL